jgi:hypothetical protein
MAQETSAIRTVYDFPVAAHICTDGRVHYTKLVRRARAEQPEGVCPLCQTLFQYRKPQPSRQGRGATHF